MINVVGLPRLNANEDELLIAEMLVDVGEHVAEGDPLFVVESSKSIEDVPSPIDGFVRAIRAESGEMLAVGAPICVLSETADEELPADALAPEAAGEAGDGEPRAQKVTAKQRLLAKKGTRTGRAAKHKASPREEIETPRLAPSGELDWVREMRRVLHERCGDDSQHPARTWTSDDLGDGSAHEAAGAFIDEGCALGAGSSVSCRRLFIGRGVRLGAGVRLVADTIHLGSAVTILDGTTIETGELLVEEGVLFATGVSSDMSGGRSADSRLIVGAQSLIAGGSFLNTSREILIERQAAVSPRAMLFTHSFWQSVLDGYSASFHPIRVCERAWIGAGCQVLPGVTVGEGSVAISNSTLVEDVPAFAMVGGVPAKTIRSQIRKTLGGEQQRAILRGVMTSFAEHLRFRGCEVDVHSDGDELRVRRDDFPERHVLVVDASNRESVPRRDDATYVVLGSTAEGLPGAVFDVDRSLFSGEEDRVTHELRNFLRRHGIRFAPFDWGVDASEGL